MSAASPSSFSTALVQQVIDLRQPQELSVWMALLGCSEERLRLAIAAVGPDLDEVCNHLGAWLPASAGAFVLQPPESASPGPLDTPRIP
jgi:hypothetical protein